MTKKIIVSGVGCSLVDTLYNNVSFSSDNFKLNISRKKGDGGLVPGNLVFKSDFERFKGEDFETTLKSIVDGKEYDKINIGGPGIVSMIHASQLSNNENSKFCFYGARGNDSSGEFIVSLLEKTPLNYDNYIVEDNANTPSTIVLSDSGYDKGNGERIFVNSLGAARNYKADALNDEFFSSDIVVFGGTALVPEIHDNITELLQRAKQNKCITVVNTVYDFRNESANPDKKWPLGKSDDSYDNIDLLLMDKEEALRMSGAKNIEDAIAFFKDKGTGAFIITGGTDDIIVYSDGKLFKPIDRLELPISNAVATQLKAGMGEDGDTTGCGDNFVGGVIASIVSQLQKGLITLNLEEASSWGVVSGGTTCYYMGGMYEEEKSGDKLSLIKPYYSMYKEQISVLN